jgi:hypothetical protein
MQHALGLCLQWQRRHPPDYTSVVIYEYFEPLFYKHFHWHVSDLARALTLHKRVEA